jgi:uncharacterized protein YutD
LLIRQEFLKIFCSFGCALFGWLAMKYLMLLCGGVAIDQNQRDKGE